MPENDTASRSSVKRVVKDPPPGLSIEASGGELTIVRSWRNWTVVPLVFFCIIWNGMMAVMFWQALAAGQHEILLFGSLHAAVGIGILYSVLLRLFNRTRITVSYREVVVRHGPFPWPGKRSIPVYQLDQVFVRRVMVRTKNGTRHVFRLIALDKNQKEIVLVKALESEDHALFIEREIETIVGIEDRPVEGEHQPDPFSRNPPSFGEMLRLGREAVEESRRKREEKNS